MLAAQNFIQRGNIVFKEEIEGDMLEGLVCREPLSWLIDDEDWDITGRKYREINQTKSLNLMKKLYITSLKIRWNEAPNIIRDIQDISFPKLKHLSLNGNNIQNLQIFSKLDLKCLKILNLKQNNVTNCKALRKCRFPQLKELLLYKNRMTRDFMVLFEMYAPQLETIWTTPQNDCFDCNDSLGWVFRLESKKIKHLYVRHHNSQKLNVSTWKQMVVRCHVGVKLTYELRDDIGLRLE